MPPERVSRYMRLRDLYLGLRVKVGEVNPSPNEFTLSQRVESDKDSLAQVRKIREANCQEQDEAIDISE